METTELKIMQMGVWFMQKKNLQNSNQMTKSKGKTCLPWRFDEQYTSFIFFKHVMHFWRRRQWHPTPVLLHGKSHGQRGLVGCSPWGHTESDSTERLHFHFSLSCIGEGNGNPLQCFCLENPRDGGAWWAAVYGVAQSQTLLKRLSSSSMHFGVLFPPFNNFLI